MSIEAGAPTVRLRDVSKWYGPVIGVNEVSLDFGPGITGLLGPNGAGKSTIMKLISGLLRPSIGDVRVGDSSPWRSAQARRQIGFMPEADAFYEEMSPLDFVRVMAEMSGLGVRMAKRRSEAALEQVGLTENRHKALRACSKGMRQRAKVAQALVHDPTVVVLDEPLSGIDPAGRMELMDLFRTLSEGGRTVLVSSHILHEIERLADRIVLVAHGRVLAAGTLTSIRELLAEYPLTVRITSERPRELASILLREAAVSGVSVGSAASHETLTVKVHRPDVFFERLPGIVVDLGVEVTRVEATDASAEAVFHYLVGDDAIPEDVLESRREGAT